MMTLTDALAHHGITITDADVARRMALTTLTYAEAYDHAIADESRARGIIHVCLGCGTVTGVADGTPEYDRVATRDAIDWDAYVCDTFPTCEDADAYLF